MPLYGRVYDQEALLELVKTGGRESTPEFMEPQANKYYTVRTPHFVFPLSEDLRSDNFKTLNLKPKTLNQPNQTRVS